MFDRLFFILILLAPQEFNFPTDKRLQNPPIELFSKVDGTWSMCIFMYARRKLMEFKKYKTISLEN